MKKAAFIGGPLAGRSVVIFGRACIYRDDVSGMPLPVRKGDRVISAVKAAESGLYFHQFTRSGKHVYIHISLRDKMDGSKLA